MRPEGILKRDQFDLLITRTTFAAGAPHGAVLTAMA